MDHCSKYMDETFIGIRIHGTAKRRNSHKKGAPQNLMIPHV